MGGQDLVGQDLERGRVGLMSALLALPLRARLLVLTTICGGTATLAWQLADAGGWNRRDLLAFAGIALAVALCEQLWIPLQHGEETENFSLTDTVFAAGIILVRPSAFLLGVALGAVVGQAVRRTAPLKLGFNVGQFAISLGLASLVYGAVSPAETATSTWYVAAGAMAVYAVVNIMTVALVIALASGEPFLAVLLPGLLLSILHSAGNVALGVLAALLIVFEPLALPLLAVPVGLSYLAYRGWLRLTKERGRIRELTLAADAMARRGDVTERVPEQQEAEDTALLASTLNRMLAGLEGAFLRERRFIRETSHELRTPITICRGYLEVLGKHPSPEAMRTTVEVVLDELHRMGRIVEDMATLARVEHPDFVRRRTIELRPFVDDLAAKAKPLLNGRLRIELPPAGAILDGDGQRLTQALLNLLHNAAHYTPAGSLVHARVVEEAGAWRFEVTDAGGGLQAGLEEAVFSPFVRAETDRSGSGLGLAIARGIAEAHGGTAGVDNRPGEGATFWLRIPR